MPYVNIRLVGKLNIDQKEKISQEITKVLSEVANKPKESILIMIDELEKENVAKAGSLISNS